MKKMIAFTLSASLCVTYLLTVYAEKTTAQAQNNNIQVTSESFDCIALPTTPEPSAKIEGSYITLLKNKNINIDDAAIEGEERKVLNHSAARIVKNGTAFCEPCMAASGNIDIAYDIYVSSGDEFDDKGKIKTVSEGTVMTTLNKNDISKTDKAFFIRKAVEPGEKVLFNINTGTRSATKAACYSGDYAGDVLFGIFISDIPDNEHITLE